MRPVVAVVLFSIATAAGAEELKFDVKFNDSMITASDTGLSLGDRIILADTLSGENGTGKANGTCTITDVQGVMICNITFVLAEGTISTQFANTPPPEKHFALFAGTGTFAGREGAGVLVEHGDGTGSLTLTIDD